LTGTQRERARSNGGALEAGSVAVGGLMSGAGGSVRGGLAQLINTKLSATKINGFKHFGNIVMLLILLEALGALAVIVLIVWWTMFSGRKNGERKD
jgi:hypothetical protein